MLQVPSTQKLEQLEVALRHATEKHGGSLLAVTHIGQLLRGRSLAAGTDAVVFTLCLPDLYAPLLTADIRFAALLPMRIAASTLGRDVMLDTISPREFCRALHRPELEGQAVPLEAALRAIMEETSQPVVHAAAARRVSVLSEYHPTEEQVNMRAALPQRIDCHGSKVEDLAGVGVHDAQGG